MSRVYITITLDEDQASRQRSAAGLFPLGTLSFTGGAVNLIGTLGTEYYKNGLGMHLHGECSCGIAEHTANIRQDIEQGRDVLTVYRGPAIEPETWLVFYTRADRTRTVVCTGVEDAYGVMAEVSTLKPEQSVGP